MEETFKQHPSKCIKIVLFGPESTGKTTLAKQLAAHYSTQWVPEYMRTFLQKKWDEKREPIARQDVLPIAAGQVATENALSKAATNFLFCDTNLLEIQVYCEYYYEGWCPAEIVNAFAQHAYDYYFLTDIDVPWEADNLRDRPFDRSILFRSFETALQQRDLPYTTLQGTNQARLKEAIALLNKRFR